MIALPSVSRTVPVISTFLCIAASCGILFLPQAAAEGAGTGLSFCAKVLIPSLFPFMVLSSFVVKSGLSSFLSRPLRPITQHLFHLPGCAGATIVMALIGGYPSGARGIKALVEQGEITPKQGEQMLTFCVGAGPAFVISVVGTGLLGSAQAGIILFVSQIAASVLVGILSGRLSRESHFSRPASSQISSVRFADALVESTADSTSGMLNMCAFVILFSTLLSLLRESGFAQVITQALLFLGVPSSAADSLIPILLEVTNGCTLAAQNGASPAFLSFALGWAGICVHFQIFTSLNGLPFSRIKFMGFRLLHGGISALFSGLVLHLSPKTSEVFSTVSQPVQPLMAADLTGSLMLLAVCAMFLLTLSAKDMDFTKKKC